jgi:hypothetical protein
MRLFRRRKDAMDVWLADSSGSRGGTEARWSAEPAFEHAPDLDPSDVPPPKRTGMTGRPLPKHRGGITGLDSGGHTPPGHHVGGA